jgi:hypothetical protein
MLIVLVFVGLMTLLMVGLLVWLLEHFRTCVCCSPVEGSIKSLRILVATRLFLTLIGLEDSTKGLTIFFACLLSARKSLKTCV